MTKRMLVRRLWVTGVALAALAISIAGMRFYSEPLFEVAVALMPVPIVIAAAYLAHAFQQRSLYVQALRTLWSQIIVALNDLREYVDLPDPSLAQYAHAKRSISIVIDEMRGFYRNVGESEEHIGYYPFEPLHDMRKALEALGHDAPDVDQRADANEQIEQAWFALRQPFLAEFETPEPTSPITRRGAVSTQRPGQRPDA